MIFSIIYILLITFAIGLPVSILVSPKMNLSQRTGISFPLGIGIFTLVMYLTNLAGLKFSVLNNLLLLLLFSVPLVLVTGRKLRNHFTDIYKNLRNPELSLFEKTALILLGFLVISSLASNFYWPVHTWDALTLYDFRAKVFVQTGFIKNVLIDNYYLEYPLFTSLAHTTVYLAGGVNPKFIYTLFYLSFGLSFYGLLREFVSRKLSLVFSLILLSAPIIFEHSLNSYTNLPYTIFFSLGAVYFYLWDKKHTKGFLALSAIFIGLSSWTRSIEPFWMGILLVVVVTSLYRKRLTDILRYLLIFFPIQQAWRIFQSTYGPRLTTGGEITSYLQVLTNIFNFQQWSLVLPFFVNTIVRPWGPIFIVTLLAFIYLVLVKKWRGYFLIFFITLVLFLMLLVGTFINSYLMESGCFLGCSDAATRLSMIIFPILIYCSALAVGNWQD